MKLTYTRLLGVANKSWCLCDLLEWLEVICHLFSLALSIFNSYLLLMINQINHQNADEESSESKSKIWNPKKSYWWCDDYTDASRWSSYFWHNHDDHRDDHRKNRNDDDFSVYFWWVNWKIILNMNEIRNQMKTHLMYTKTN